MSATTTTENPLLDGWRDVHGKDAPHSWLSRGFDGGCRPDRDRLSAVYSFAVPTDAALDLIASFGPVVEIGAGTGYWASLLVDRGCDVVAYDHLGRNFHRWFPTGKGLLYADVRRGGTPMAERHADRTLLLVWPPYGTPMAANALRYFERGGGKRLVYVGEGYGGCTGDDDFFGMLHDGCWQDPCDPDHHASRWHQTHELTIPQWFGINDYLTVYERQS